MSKDKYIYFIYQDLQGDLSTADKTALQGWLAESAENRAMQSQIAQSMNIVDGITPNFDVDVENDYSKIAEKLGFNDSTIADKSSKTRRLVIYGAVILFGLSLLYYLFQTQNNPTPTQIYAETGIGETKSIALADGSTVILNELSSFEYPSTFAGDTRSVSLKGEAYFDIAKSVDQAFIITTPDANVTVLGTAFNVDAYDQDNEVVVTVQRGKVSLSDLGGENEVILTANEVGNLVKKTNLVSESTVDNLNAIGWKSQELSFKNATLQEVFETLESVFKVQIKRSDALNNCRYSMTKQKVELDTLMTELSTIYDFEIARSSDKSYILTGGTCD